MTRIAPARFLACTLIACLSAAGAAMAAVAPAWSLLPQPVSARPADSGAVEIADGAVIAVHGMAPALASAFTDRFAQHVAEVNGWHVHAAATGDAHALITFDIDPAADVTDESGYRVTVNGDGIRVSARTARGAFYGSVTVEQLLTPSGWVRGAPVKVAHGVIDDYPRFAWRALLLDSGRHYQSVADIKKLIDWMSLHKMNVLLWHLTEDQGWRLEISRYPELTRTGACRAAVGLDSELTGSPEKPYCAYYTQAQARDIVRYAAERYVDVVPEIDMPGHSQAAIAAYPWLGVTGARPSVWTDWGVSPWLLKPDEKTLQFVDNVLDEVLKVFPSRYISLGGDEADKQQWNASPDVRAQMQRLGLANMDQLQGWFTNQVAAKLIGHGRTPVGWDDELVAGVTLPASDVVMSWHGDDNERVALTAIRQGHDVIMTPQESLYFDHLQSDLPDEWAGPPPAATLRQAYDTVVIPEGASASEARHIIGVQAGLWTEQMRTFAHDEHAVFPRVAALAELGWSPAAAHDWNGFLQRLPAQLARYRALGIGYADSAFAASFHVTAQSNDAFQVALANQAGFGTFRYTTDGSAPTVQSSAYDKPLTFTGHTTLRVATFASDGFELAAPRTQLLDTAAVLGRDSSSLDTCSHQPASRLDGALPARGTRPMYAVDIGNACWLWPQAPLGGVTHVMLTAERITWRFGDEAKDAVARAKSSADGDMEIHVDSCTGPLLARMPLPSATQAKGQVHLDAQVVMPVGTGVRDLCVFATGDPRDGQWALGRMVFLQ